MLKVIQKLKSYQANTLNCMNSQLYLKIKEFFQMNISLLPFHSEELSALLSAYKLPFDLLGITESCIRTNKLPFSPF